MIRSKLPNINASIFSVMSQLANEHKAINLSQGFPDFAVSPKLISLITKYMKKGENQYAPMQGIMELRQIISEKTEKLYNRKYNPETEITITAGATQALHTAISTLVKEDDEVIVIEPAYDSYVPVIKLNGGRPVFVQMKHPNYSIDWNEAKKIITSRTSLIIINSPQNPTGATLGAKDMEELEKLVKGSKISIISDEVYEHIIFDDQKHESVAKYPNLAERTMIISSFGKTFHATGWKIGYCIAPESLMKEFRKIHQFTVFSVNTPIQYALAEYLKNEEEYLKLPEFYQSKRDFFIERVKDSRFSIIPAKGSYFQLLNYTGITEEKDFDFAVRLTKEKKLASVPISAFHHNKLDTKTLRFCFAKSEKTLEQAAKILCSI